GRRALVRLDVGRMVVALHLEDDRLAVADIDHAGILARTLDHARTRGRQGAEPLLGRLVGAVLVPHRREDAELGEGRLAASQLEDALILVRLEAMRSDQLWRDGKVVADHGSSNVRRTGGDQWFFSLAAHAAGSRRLRASATAGGTVARKRD